MCRWVRQPGVLDTPCAGVLALVGTHNLDTVGCDGGGDGDDDGVWR